MVSLIPVEKKKYFHLSINKGIPNVFFSCATIGFGEAKFISTRVVRGLIFIPKMPIWGRFSMA
jgi:hypothetical protein